MHYYTPPGRVVGASPLFRQLAQDIGLVPVINRSVRWDAAQCRWSPGERLLVMILDILTGKSPLHRVIERWTTMDVELLAGIGRDAAELTDDSLGRALDKLARAQPARVFSAVAAQAYVREGIPLGSGHWDSTSCTLTGAYADPPPEGTACPQYGHSKDRRPVRSVDS